MTCLLWPCAAQWLDRARRSGCGSPDLGADHACGDFRRGPAAAAPGPRAGHARPLRHPDQPAVHRRLHSRRAVTGTGGGARPAAAWPQCSSPGPCPASSPDPSSGSSCSRVRTSSTWWSPPSCYGRGGPLSAGCQQDPWPLRQLAAASPSRPPRPPRREPCSTPKRQMCVRNRHRKMRNRTAPESAI